MTDTADRELVRKMLEEMSRQVSGVDAETFATPESFMPMIDVPDGPMDPNDPAFLEPDVHTVDDGHDHGSAGGGSRYAWGGHQNGRIPADQLAKIGQGGHVLESAAAKQWKAMRAAAKADGVTLSLTDSYRSYDAQVDVRRRKGHQVATAKPGTSVHGWGRAVDANVNDPKTLAWLRANGAQYGWINPAWAQKAGKSFEPWHFEFVGVQ